MENFNKYFNKLFIITIILFLICFIIYIYHEFIGRCYLDINANNENTVIKMLENSNISINGKLKRIGNMQGLGDWYLYLEYLNSSEDSTILNDGEAENLYKYIKNNGSVGGTKGKIVRYVIKICMIIILIYIVYKICHYVSRKIIAKLQF